MTQLSSVMGNNNSHLVLIEQDGKFYWAINKWDNRPNKMKKLEGETYHFVDNNYCEEIPESLYRAIKAHIAERAKV